MSEPTPIRFNTRVDNTSNAEKVDKTAPTEPPKSKRDFGRILNSTDKNKNTDEDNAVAEGEGIVREAAEDGSIAEKQPLNLFDLSGRKEYSTKPLLRKYAQFSSSSDGEVAEGARTVKKGSNSPIASSTHESGDLDGALEVGRGASSNEEEVSIDPDERRTVEQDQTQAHKMTSRKEFPSDDFTGGGTGSSFADSEKGKSTTRFVDPQTDLSYVNPLGAAGQQIQIQGAKGETPVTQTSNLNELIKILVEKANEIKLDGKTDTTITLKHPPILAGANLVVTSFDSARGQFNISFENLTQAGKNLLDLQGNQESLMKALSDKGYTVHILTTTTLNERVAMNHSETPDSRRDPQDEGQKQPRQRNNQEDET